MPDDTSTWALIHSERAALADTFEKLTPQQWATPSLCSAWSVRDVAGHLLSSAEQTPAGFLAGMASTGLRFSALMQRGIGSRSGLSTEQLVDRLRARTTTTNRPPAPAVAMLGEVVLHGEDLRRPLRLERVVDEQAVNACLDANVRASFPVGGKKRIAGLRLVATDTGWSYGSGPEVTGSGVDLLVAMTGRAAGLAGLSGDGLPALTERVSRR